jgi:2-dehydro-3-deoxygluconokinase
MLAGWAAEGVGTGQVARMPGRVPGLYIIQTDARGERRFSYWRDSAPARALFDSSETAEIVAALPSYDLLYFSGITLSLYGDAGRARFVKLNLDTYGGGFTARALIFLTFWLISV